MSTDNRVSDEQLNAFLDNELDAIERERVLRVIRHDKELSAQYCDLRQLKEMATLAYLEPPMPEDQEYETTFSNRNSYKIQSVAAVFALLIIGGVIGWMFKSSQEVQSDPMFNTMAELDLSKIQKNKILVHVSNVNNDKLHIVFDTVENLFAQSNNKNLQIEIVANSYGLDFLRAGSPYEQQIQTLKVKYPNISFLACGAAMENARKRDGGEVQLIPSAERIPLALARIFSRLQDGWLYLRG